MGCLCAAVAGTRGKDFVCERELGVLRQRLNGQQGNAEGKGNAQVGI